MMFFGSNTVHGVDILVCAQKLQV